MSNAVSNTTAQSKNINLTMVSLWINNSLKTLLNLAKGRQWLEQEHTT